MNKINYAFSIMFLFALISLACGSKSDAFVFGLENGKQINVTKYSIYKDNNGSVFLFLQNPDNLSSIRNEPISYIELKRNDTIIRGKAINLFYSRDIDLKPFIYYIDNRTKTLTFKKVEGKEMLFIGNEDALKPLLDEQKDKVEVSI